METPFIVCCINISKQLSIIVSRMASHYTPAPLLFAVATVWLNIPMYTNNTELSILCFIDQSV
uniref:Uncharacterized protein n=1 Tax=Romanomermis culicivorax TaxID=13658 RepID=A0A915ISB7_ROMCU